MWNRLYRLGGQCKTEVSDKKIYACAAADRPDKAPGQFVALHRLKVAQYNLAMTSRRVDEIARLCGFESIYAFSHFFKKHTGQSPLAWRKANRFEKPE